jgi:general secretion pathway protein E
MTIQLSLNFLLTLLEEYHIVTAEQRELLESRQEYYSSLYESLHKKEPFSVDLLLFMADREEITIKEASLLKLVAGRAGCDFITIDPLKIDAHMATHTISVAYARSNLVMPLYEEDGALVLAMANPFRMEVIDQLASITGKPIIPVVASTSNLEKIINDIYGFKRSIKAATKDFSRDNLDNIEQLTSIGDSKELDDKHIVNAVDHMLKYAVEQGASDIHIEPKRTETHIRFRIDGVLHTIYNFSIDVHLPFTSRLKMLARMDISEKKRPQDGRIKIAMPSGDEVEIRCSSVPVVNGEKMVLRILESGSFIKDLSNIGFVDRQLDEWRSSMKRGFGMMLVTGPTGSGKSTTLYSTLKEVANPDINIISVEDPIEIVLEEINQIGVNPKADVTFSSALKHILRQDPDIIMIGEIRDKETAENAVQAALTGHLVFSTLHTNDTASTVERLKDLGLEPYLLGSVLNGIIAQRLVRKICPHCSYEREMSEDEKIILKLPVESSYKVKDSEGCVKCRYTGYKGRTAIVEYMPVSSRIRTLISGKSTTEELRNNALMDGMVTLREAAIRKLADGATSFDEIVKALYYD